MPIEPILELVQSFWQRKRSSRGSFAWRTLIPGLFSTLLVTIVFVWSVEVSDIRAVRRGTYKKTVGSVLQLVEGILKFLLPLMLTAALAKNRAGMHAFRILCCDLKQVQWMLQRREGLQVSAELHTTLKLLPFAVKYHLRGEESYAKLIQGETPLPFVQEKVGQGVGLVDAMCASIECKMGQMKMKHGATPFQTIQAIMNAITNLEDLNAYRLPHLMLVFFYALLLLWFLAYPISAVEIPWEERLANSCVAFYVFCGMYNLSLQISEPFGKIGRASCRERV